MNNLTNLWLRVIKKNSLLPMGEIVYCIVDEGHQFIVKSTYVHSGVTEFIFNNSSREKFIILE